MTYDASDNSWQFFWSFTVGSLNIFCLFYCCLKDSHHKGNLTGKQVVTALVLSDPCCLCLESPATGEKVVCWLLSLTKVENPIWNSKKMEVAIRSEFLVKALSVCNLCCFQNQRNTSGEAVCVFWPSHSNQQGYFGRRRISVWKVIVTIIILNKIGVH